MLICVIFIQEKNRKCWLTIVKSLKQALSNNFDIFHWNFHDFLFHLIMQIDSMLSSRDIVSKVISTEILLQVV